VAREWPFPPRSRFGRNLFWYIRQSRLEIAAQRQAIINYRSATLITPFTEVESGRYPLGNTSQRQMGASEVAEPGPLLSRGRFANAT
jgi:hypothetical protein